jgi:WS/DGAT C-terminal domain
VSGGVQIILSARRREAGSCRPARRDRGWLPAGLVSVVSGRLTSTNDVQVSSIPGVPYPVYVAGSRITRMYPCGPLPGCAPMITLLSHDGTCCIGLNTDTLAVTDPGALADDLRPGWARW